MIDTKDNTYQELFDDCKSEISQINDFFKEAQYANVFSQLFLYSKKKIGTLELDVRDSIIGVKAIGERLRYYATKSGMLKIKVSQTDAIKTYLLDATVEELYACLDRADCFFLENKSEVAIKSFADSTDNRDVMQGQKFYDYIDENYQKAHDVDGKAIRSQKHAQKCISSICELNTLLNNNGIECNIFEMKTCSEVTLVYDFLKKSKDGIPGANMKWYYYVLRRYRLFLKDTGVNKKNLPKATTISKAKQKLIDALELEINNLFDICHSNFIVDSKLFGRMSLLHKSEMQALGEKCTIDTIFRICIDNFSNQFYFQKPFILKEHIATIGNDEFIYEYAQSLDEFTISDINRYIANMHLKRLASYRDFMCNCSEQYVQVDKELMISKSKLLLSAQYLKELKHELLYYIESFGSIDSEIYCGYSSLPMSQYPWSKYLLLGIVRSYFSDSFQINYRSKRYDELSYLISVK